MPERSCDFLKNGFKGADGDGFAQRESILMKKKVAGSRDQASQVNLNNFSITISYGHLTESIHLPGFV